MTPLVSVVMPSYNSADTLERAAASVLSQMEELELLIVDDCSSDSAFSIAQRLARDDARVRAFRLQKNSGVSAARNYAMQKARGEWLALLDSDDWFADDRLINLLEVAHQADVEMVADNQYFFDKQAESVVGTALRQTGKEIIVDLDGFLAGSNATKNFDYGMLKPLFRADFIHSHGIEYDISSRISEDYYMLLRFFAAGGRAVVVDTPYYFYTQPFGSLSRKPQQCGAGHYNHHQQKLVHKKSVAMLRNEFSDRQLKQLSRRQHEIDALIIFYNLRKALRNKDIKLVLKLLRKSNVEFWKMMFRKISGRIWWSVFSKKVM